MRSLWIARPRRGRVRLFPMLVCIVLWALVYHEALRDVLGAATRGVSNSYLVMVPFVSMYLAWLRRRVQVRHRRGQGAWIGVILVALAMGMWYVGYDRDVLVLWHSAMIVALIGIVVAIRGGRVLSQYAAAIVVLFAVVPLPGLAQQALAQPLQLFASTVSAEILQFSGVDAVRSGNLIEINGFKVAVGEACNGMRLVMPLAIVMYAFVFSLPLKTLVRLFLVALAMPVAIFCNVIRLVPTSLAYGFFPDWAPAFHNYAGWLMIPLALVMLLGFLRAFEAFDLPVARLRLAVS